MRKRFRGNPELRQLIQGAGWLLTSDVLNSAVQVLTGFFVAAVLGPDLFGVLGLAGSSTSLIGQFASFRSWELVTTYLPRSSQEGKGASVVGAGLLLDVLGAAMTFAVVWLSAPVLATTLLGDPGYAIYIKLSAVGTSAFLASSAFTACLRLADRYAVIGLANSATALLQGGLTFGVYLVSSDRVAYLILVASGVQVLRLWWLAIGFYRFARQPIGFGGVAGLLRLHMRFLFATYITGALRGCAKLGDGLLLGYFSTPGDVGRYRVAKKVVLLLIQAIDPLYQTLYPKLARILAERRLRAFWRTNAQVTALSSLVIAVAAIGLSLSTPIVVRLLGEGYLDAIELVRIMVLNPIFWAISLWGPAAALSLGSSGLVAGMETVNVAASMGLSAALVGPYGATGLGIAFAVGRILSAAGWFVVLPVLMKRARRLVDDAGRVAP